MKVLSIFFLLLSLLMFTSTSSINALMGEESPSEEIRQENSNELQLTNSENQNNETKSLKNETDLESIFGSEQVFPFEPGFS